jgi:hypothetical protein
VTGYAIPNFICPLPRPVQQVRPEIRHAARPHRLSRSNYNGATSGAQMVVKGSHFENPNYAVPGSANYDYIVLDNHPGNLLRITDSYFLQDAPENGPSRFIMANGGRIMACGLGMYTPAGSPLKHFVALANQAAVDTYGFNDLSGNIAGSWAGR